jgi:hypothetical protein
VTELLGPVVNTSASYSGGSSLKNRPVDLLSWLKFFVVFLSPSRQMPEGHLKIRLRPLPSKSFSIPHSLISFSFDSIIWAIEKASLNKLQINKTNNFVLMNKPLSWTFRGPFSRFLLHYLLWVYRIYFYYGPQSCYRCTLSRGLKHVKAVKLYRYRHAGSIAPNHYWPLH